MINTILKKIIGSRNERVLKQLSKTVTTINALEPKMQALSDDQLRAKTQEFRQRLQQGETVDDILPEAFAVVRETSVRTLGLRHFDVQLIGGMALHQGKIAEMRTGEGKTLVSTLAAYLNALSGKGVHIVTVNDYLAQRDAKWMGPIYEFLGLTVGVNLPDVPFEEKKQAYAADITYGTNNEFGFDYLRDNMVFSTEFQVQRSLHFAIVDEVDSILIDEARTPLIISGPVEDSSELYVQIDKLVPKLTKQEEEDGPGDFTVDEKTKQAYLTEAGQQKVEDLLMETGLLKTGESLYDFKNMGLLHHLNAALRAHALFHRDVEYVVKDGEIFIVDEHTGRLMPGRRWSEGLHQAVEAKEGVKVHQENQTLATITFQNYFRLYQKLSGMTGTADTEAYEFQEIYDLEVIVIPTNKPMIREDKGDQIYLNFKGKFNAILKDIKYRHEKGQPILVGTASIETSEYLSNLLRKEGVPHQVLNAKQHEKEAKIIAQAGRPATITIATNMAGRGTDIVLGGSLDAELAELVDPSEVEIEKRKRSWQKRHDQVIGAGGLHVLGTERNESRRIDNQLRGRSGRQGDPGSSQFYLSLEDNLMRIFASDRVSAIMQRLGLKEDEVIQHKIVTKAIENAQRKVEGYNFDVRKHLLEFDDVANDQRKVIYRQRQDLLHIDDISETIQSIQDDVAMRLVNKYVLPQSFEEQWDLKGLERQLQQDFSIALNLRDWVEKDEQVHEEDIRRRVTDEIAKAYKDKEERITTPVMRQLEKSLMLQVLDQHWKEHLAAMDHLRRGIHLRGYAQQNPTQEYKRESFHLFAAMLDSIKHEVIAGLCSVKIDPQELEAVHVESQMLPMEKMQFQHTQLAGVGNDDAQNSDLPVSSEVGGIETFVREAPKVGRNEPCPCGSGRKYKHCCGQLS